MPFQKKLASVFSTIQNAVVDDCGLVCQRADDIYSAGIIVNEVWAKISEAQLVIADATGRNANVLYEMGLAHALGKDVIILSQSMDAIPFDLQHRRVIVYDIARLGELRVKLAKTVENLKWKAPEIRQWLSTNLKDTRVGLAFPVEGTVVNVTPIEAIGQIVGLPSSGLRCRIQGFVVTNKEHEQASSWVDGEGFWKISQIHLGARNHKMFFRVYDEAGRIVAKTDSIKVVLEGSPSWGSTKGQGLTGA